MLFILSLPLSAWLLRQNNLKMIELRDAVVLIDARTGDIKQIEPALLEFREFVLSHMNANLPNNKPLELPGSFNKAVDQARARASVGDANQQVYQQAQAECEKLEIPLSVRAQCIQDYVLANAPAGEEPTLIEFPPKEQFSYNFISPRWSPDLAGLTVLISFFLGVVAVSKYLLDSVYPRITSSIQNDPLE